MTTYRSLPMTPALSTGCLQQIIKTKANVTSGGDSHQEPIVQILGTKRVANGSIRVILYDGVHTLKTAVIKKSPENDAKFDGKQMENFSIVQLVHYWVSVITGHNDMEVLIVGDLVTLMRGSLVGRKLEVSAPVASVNPIGQSMQNNQNLNNTVSAGIDTSKVCPIAAITPFFNGWLIRARITSKIPVRTYTTKDGREGKVFSFDATDHSSDIRVTAFNAECDKYHDIIEKDMNYLIQKGTVKTANRKFSNCKSDYEIMLTSESVIELCQDDVPLPPVSYRFRQIGQLVDDPVGVSVDVCAVIRVVDECQKIVAKKDQKEYQKRDVTLVDKSLAEVRLTLWRREAEEFAGCTGQVMAIKNAIVGDFRGRTLSCAPNATLELDPDLPEAHILKGWYERELALGGAGNLKSVQPLSKASGDAANGANEYRFLAQINEQSVPQDGQSLYYNCKGTVVATNRADRHLYKSCGNNGCSKKVREENGFYYCDKCGHNGHQFQWRLMLSVLVSDATGDQWVTAFHEVAEKLIGRPVAELSALYESSVDEYQAVVSALLFRTFQLRCGSKVDEYNGERRVKSTCFSAQPVDPIQRARQLMASINEWTN